MSDSVWPHRRQPTRLPCPWDSPGKNIGVGCHFLPQCTKVKSESEVAWSCLTLSNPMDCSLPGSSIHGIFQARVLEWVSLVQMFTLTHKPGMSELSAGQAGDSRKKWCCSVSLGTKFPLSSSKDPSHFLLRLSTDWWGLLTLWKIIRFIQSAH